jgi:DNA-binding transcriptional LysR family regulator
MDLKALKTFHTIVKHGSFIRAAEELNYVQSTITMQIQKLESDLGVQLIDRGKQIKLTEAGRLFYEQSLPIVKSMEMLQTNMLDFLQGESGSIRLGATEPTASYRLPAILKQFFSLFPKINVSVDIASTYVLTERILKGEIDLALCSPPDLGTELFFESLFNEKFVLLMQKDHPLSLKKEIFPNDLIGHRLLITSETCSYRKKLEMIIKETSSDISLETMDIESMTALNHYVESGIGIALLPEIFFSNIPKGTVIKPLCENFIELNLGLLYKVSDYPMNLAAGKMYGHLKQEFCKQENIKI